MNLHLDAALALTVLAGSEYVFAALGMVTSRWFCMCDETQPYETELDFERHAIPS